MLRAIVAGFAPRPRDEIDVLLRHANHGREHRLELAASGLASVAAALNRNDLAKAQLAAVFMRVPELDSDSAMRLILADDILTKYDPDQPRDSHGRWSSGPGGQGDGAPGQPATRSAASPVTSAERPPETAPNTIGGPGAAGREATAVQADREADDADDGDGGDNPLLQQVSWTPPASRSPYPTGPKGPSTAPRFSPPGPSAQQVIGEASPRDAIAAAEDYINLYASIEADARNLRVREDAMALFENKSLKPPSLMDFIFPTGGQSWGTFRGYQCHDRDRTQFVRLPTTTPSGNALFEFKTPPGSNDTIWTNGSGKWYSLRNNPPIVT